MFREMRRKDKALSKDDAINMLKDASFGTLALNGADGFPYSVPVSFAYGNDKIYFHGAKAGLKYDSLKADSKVCFSVVEKDNVIPDEFTTLYRSVVLYGNCLEVTDADELKQAYNLILDKYSKGFEKEGAEYVKKHGGATVVFGIEIEHLTAKGKG